MGSVWLDNDAKAVLAAAATELLGRLGNRPDFTGMLTTTYDGVLRPFTPELSRTSYHSWETILHELRHRVMELVGPRLSVSRALPVLSEPQFPTLLALHPWGYSQMGAGRLTVVLAGVTLLALADGRFVVPPAAPPQIVHERLQWSESSHRIGEYVFRNEKAYTAWLQMGWTEDEKAYEVQLICAEADARLSGLIGTAKYDIATLRRQIDDPQTAPERRLELAFTLARVIGLA